MKKTFFSVNFFSGLYLCKKRFVFILQSTFTKNWSSKFALQLSKKIQIWLQSEIRLNYWWLLFFSDFLNKIEIVYCCSYQRECSLFEFTYTSQYLKISILPFSHFVNNFKALMNVGAEKQYNIHFFTFTHSCTKLILLHRLFVVKR